MMRKLKKTVVQFTIAACILLSTRLLWVSWGDRGSMIIAGVISVLFCGLAYGLWKEIRWALRLTSAVYLLIAITMPFVLFHPFRMGEYFDAGKVVPSAGETLLWLIPLEFCLFTAVYVLGLREKKGPESIAAGKE